MSWIGDIGHSVGSLFGFDDDDHHSSSPAAHAAATPRPSQHVAARMPTRFTSAPTTRAGAGGPATSGADDPTARFTSAVQALQASRSRPTTPTASTQRPPASSSSGMRDASAATLQIQRALRARAEVFDASGASSGARHAALGDVDSLGSGTDVAAEAARNVQTGLDYYATRFGRDGLDGAGNSVTVDVQDTTTENGSEVFRGNGGYYEMQAADGSQSTGIHYGRGASYTDAQGRRIDQRSMAYADDLSIHELTHGVIRSVTGAAGGEADEAGATNEGIADVMAASATRDWSIGEGMYARDSDVRRMRNIADPDDPTAFHTLATDVADVRARTANGQAAEEHWASGVISTAAYRVQRDLGGEVGWRAVEQTFYDTIQNRRMGDQSYEAVAAGLRQSAAARFGTGSSQYTAFDRELRAAGL